MRLIIVQAGNYVKEQILSSFVRLIATTPELQTYSVQKLYASLKDDITQEGLTLAGAWVIGEYGDALLRGGQYEEEELVKEVKESDLVDLFESVLSSSYAGQVVTEYIITAAMKLTTRLSDQTQINRLRQILVNHQTNLDVEIQQRAAEYGNLFAYESIRQGVLEKMPPPEIREEQRVLGESTKKRLSKNASKKKPSQVTEQDMLLDLMGGSDLPSSDLDSTTNASQNNADLLADILSGGISTSSSPPPTSPSSSNQPKSQMNSIMDLFGSQPNAPPPQASQLSGNSGSADLLGEGFSQPTAATTPSSSNIPIHQAYNKNNLVVSFQVQRNANAIQVQARFRNASNFERLSGVALQAAVPRSQKLQLQPMGNSELDSGQESTQQMRITAVTGVSQWEIILCDRF